MTKPKVFAMIFCLVGSVAFAQSDSLTNRMQSGIFAKIGQSIKAFQLDTTAAPNDKITRTIKELRRLRGGFNINEAIEFKIEEDRLKNEVPKAEFEKFETFFKTGAGKRWLDNATIWIYRKHFTYPELKQLVKFYKTPAGQKMATDFPIIMMESLRAAEIIKELYAQQQKMNGSKEPEIGR